jgi:hypothetical protein
MSIWSVVCIISDEGTVYSLVRGEHSDSIFSGSKRECLNYIKSLPDDD